MSALVELEKELLALPAAERERLATLVWDSLADDLEVAGNPEIDPEGVELAATRDAEIESGRVQAIGHAEFLRRTGGLSE